MNKKELIEALAKDTKLSKASMEIALNSLMTHISKGAKKAPVQLVGFGTFKMTKRKARKGINPSTGEKIKIPARTLLTFKASKKPKF